MDKEIAKIAATNIAFEMMNGKKSKASFSSNGKDLCTFCNAELPRRGFELLGVRRDFGPEKCKCVEATRFWSEYDHEYNEIVSIEMEKYRMQRVDQLIQKSMIPMRWKTRTFDHFIVSPQNEKSFHQAHEYAKSFDGKSGNGLIFTGTVGTGKTHLSAAVGLELLSREYHVMFGTVTTLLAKIRNTFDDDRENEREVFRKLTRCDLLIVDDLGKEKVTDWVEQTVYEIINTRYEDNRSLIITTNMSLSDIRSKYPNTGDAIVSRIIEMCQGVKMDGSDFRKRALMRDV